ncbi:MAG: transporter [Planctomycetes bacterium]|nr:transporter [Planctomycetota bacterium]
MRLLHTAPLLPLLAACTALPRDAAPVTPQRPTLSSDTNTTARGTLELEVGAELDPGDAFASPTTLKYGVDARTEVYLGLSPYNVVDRAPASDGSGFGDTTLGARRRVWEDGRGTSAAVQLAVKLPTASEREGLGSGELDVAAAGILSRGFGERVGGTLYYELRSLGRSDRGGRDLAHALALAGAYALDDELSAFAELSQRVQPGPDDPSALVTGLAWAWSPSLVLDAAVSVGLDDDAPDAVWMLGLTTNFGPLRR